MEHDGPETFKGVRKDLASCCLSKSNFFHLGFQLRRESRVHDHRTMAVKYADDLDSDGCGLDMNVLDVASPVENLDDLGPGRFCSKILILHLAEQTAWVVT